MLAIWIKIDSEGPVFYRQVRVGKGNRDFRLFKFRSMRVGSDQKGLITVGGRDPRVTRSGYYIRKYKLDELPQLINVFIGDMSLVGPRPEVRNTSIFIPPNRCTYSTFDPALRTWLRSATATKTNCLHKSKIPIATMWK